MQTIKERADRAIYEPTDGHPLKACEVVAFARGYELGATEQKAIDDAECANQVLMGKGDAVNHYKQGFHDAIEKACEWLKENIEGGVHPQSAYGFADRFKKALEE